MKLKYLSFQEIKEILKKKLDDIDSDKTLMYDSLVVMFLSGKFDCEAGKIYDCDGEVVPRKEILEIINDCNYFKEKAKVVFVQSYNFQGIYFVLYCKKLH